MKANRDPCGGPTSREGGVECQVCAGWELLDEFRGFCTCPVAAAFCLQTAPEDTCSVWHDYDTPVKEGEHG